MRLSTQDKQSFQRQEKYARDHEIPIQNWYQEKIAKVISNCLVEILV